MIERKTLSAKHSSYSTPETRCQISNPNHFHWKYPPTCPTIKRGLVLNQKIMELSILVAKTMALVYLSVGIAALTNKISFRKMIEDFEKSPALTYIGGLMALVIGMLLVEYHNFWVKDWTVIVTILGWIAVVKGVMLLAFPQSVCYFKGWFKNSQIFSVFVIILGLVLGYFGFLA